jgi:hypothetical protein
MVEQLAHLEHGQSPNLAMFKMFKFMTCTSGCNYSLCTPDDGYGRHPKYVE